MYIFLSLQTVADFLSDMVILSRSPVAEVTRLSVWKSLLTRQSAERVQWSTEREGWNVSVAAPRCRAEQPHYALMAAQ